MRFFSCRILLKLSTRTTLEGRTTTSVTFFPRTWHISSPGPHIMTGLHEAYARDLEKNSYFIFPDCGEMEHSYLGFPLSRCCLGCETFINPYVSVLIMNRNTWNWPFFLLGLDFKCLSFPKIQFERVLKRITIPKKKKNSFKNSES